MPKMETEVVKSLRGLQYLSGEIRCSLQVHCARKPKKYTFHAQVLGFIISTFVIESVKIVAAQQEDAGEEEYTGRGNEI